MVPLYSPRAAARTAGALWLICILTSTLSFVLESRLIVRDDAAATAANIMQNESLFRLAFLGDLLSGVTYLALTALLYHLLKPVGRTLSFAATVFGGCGVAIGGVAFAAHIAPVVFLGRAASFGAFTVSQLQVMALLAYRLRLQVFSIGMVFFGIQCVLVGYLIAQSTFLPRVLGALLALGGASYVLMSFAAFVNPGVALTPLFMPVALLGEGSLTAWLLVKGIDAARWDDANRFAAGMRAA